MRTPIRPALIATALVAGAGNLPAGDDAKGETAKRELTNLDGSWQVLSFFAGGKNLLADDEAGNRSYEIK